MSTDKEPADQQLHITEVGQAGHGDEALPDHRWRRLTRSRVGRLALLGLTVAVGVGAGASYKHKVDADQQKLRRDISTVKNDNDLLRQQRDGLGSEVGQLQGKLAEVQTERQEAEAMVAASSLTLEFNTGLRTSNEGVVINGTYDRVNKLGGYSAAVDNPMILEVNPGDQMTDDPGINLMKYGGYVAEYSTDLDAAGNPEVSLSIDKVGPHDGKITPRDPNQVAFDGSIEVRAVYHGGPGDMGPKLELFNPQTHAPVLEFRGGPTVEVGRPIYK